MTRVWFEAGDESFALVPVEVRSADLSIAGRCVAGAAAVDLTPGDYHAFATYPDGPRVHAAFTVAKEAPETHVPLPARPAARHGRHASDKEPLWSGGLERDHEGADLLLTADYVMAPTPRRSTREVRAWDGDPLLGLEPHIATVSDDGRLEPQPHGRVLQTKGPDGPINVLIPPDTAVRLARPRDPKLPLPEFRSPDVAAAVGLVMRGLSAEARTLARATRDRLRHSTRAESVAWSYLMLATHEGDIASQVLHVWGERTADDFVLSAEFLAREGHHEKALRDLLRVPEAGLPAFSEGLFLASERLRLYAAADDLDDGGEAARALGALQPFAAAATPGAVLTTYRGTDPTRPGPVSSN